MSSKEDVKKKLIPQIKAKIEEYGLSSLLNLPRDEKSLNVKLFTTLMATKFKAEDGKVGYDIEVAIDKLVEQCENRTSAKSCLEKARVEGINYVSKEEVEESVIVVNKSNKRKKKVVDEESDEEEETTGKKAKKAKTTIKNAKAESESPDSPSKSPKKKTEIKAKDVKSEANQGVCDAIRQLAGAFFKQGDRIKGSAFQKAATAMATHPDPILSGKDAEKLKGVGKSTGKKVQEFLETGKIELLEEMRNGANENL